MTGPTNPRREAGEIRKDLEKQLMRWAVMRIRPDLNQPRKVFDERLLDELANNLAAIGQKCPIIGYPDPLDPEWLVLIDGERRVRAARRVPLEYLEAVVLPGPPSPAELLLAQLSLGQLREKLSAPELASSYARLMTEFGLSQQQLASTLGVSETKVSNAFAIRRVAPELQVLAAKLEPSVVPIIARLPIGEQADVMTFATTANENGKLPSRDDVQAYVAARKPSKSTRSRTFVGEQEGRKFRIDLRQDDTHESLIEFLKGLIGVVQRYKAVPVVNLSQVTAG